MGEFVSPFDVLGKETPAEPRGEEVDGQFTCQEPDCWKIEKVARYIAEAKLLTWKCSEGHISKIENFNID